MKTIYKLYFLILLFAPLSVFSQDVTYNFDLGGNGYYDGSAWTSLTVSGGTAGIALAPSGVTFSDNGVTNSTNTLKGTGAVTPNNGGVVDFTAFPSTTDQQVIFKEYLTNATTATKTGFLLRAQGSSLYGTGLKQGYLFRVTHNAGTGTTMGTVQFNIYRIESAATATSLVSNTAATLSGYNIGSAIWVKATAIGSTLTLYYSLNGTSWTQACQKTGETTYTAAGGVQAYWGFGSGVQPIYWDDVQYWDLTKNVALSGSKFVSDGNAKSPTISKTGFTSPVETVSYTGISGTSYGPSTTAPSAAGTYLMTVTEVEGVTRSASQVFTILPATFDKLYTFESDVVGSAAALTTVSTGANVSGGHTVQLFANATEGGYTVSSKTLSIASGAANTRAISSLDNFGTDLTNYSITWKEYNTTASANKHMIVLRADPTTINSTFSATPNYRPQGQGYGFLVNPTGTSALTLQIYKLNNADAFTNIATVALTPTAVQGVPLWFRASVFGSTSVLTKFEYSTDGTNWSTATSAIDETSPVASGATHIFGVNSNNQNYYFDYFGYNTISQLTTAIAKTDAAKTTMFVTVRDNTVKVANVSNFEVYNIQGVKVKEVRNNTSDQSVTLSSGVYIIRSGSVAQKAIVQ